MKPVLFFAALLWLAPAAQGQPRPPEHFPGSKGTKAHVYAERYAIYQQELRAYNAALAAKPSLPPLKSSTSDEPKVPGLGAVGEARPQSAVAVAESIEKLEAETKKALAFLAEQLDGLAGDKKSFADLDKTLETAKKVNAALLARCEAITAAGKDLSAALAKLKKALADAPKIYRLMSGDRRSKARAAASDFEEASWKDQAELCDAAASLCEKRYAQLFATTSSDRRSFEAEIDNSLTGVKRMVAVHVGWKEVLDAFPTTAQGEKVDAALAKLSTYVEDLNAYGGNMRSLTEAMKAKADDLPPLSKK